MKNATTFGLILTVIVLISGCGGGGGGNSTAPAANTAVSGTRNNALQTAYFPNDAYVEKVAVKDLATKTIDKGGLHKTNCTCHTQLDVPKDSAASLIQAMVTLLESAKDGGNIEKTLHQGEIVMVPASYASAGAAEYGNNQAILFQEQNQTMGSEVVLYIAHEMGHMQDAGFTRNEFISSTFEILMPLVAYRTNPDAYCESNPLGNPLEASIRDFKNSSGWDTLHQQGYIATMLLVRDDEGSIQKIVYDVSDPATFDKYFAAASAFLASSTPTSFKQLHCAFAQNILKNVSSALSQGIIQHQNCS